MTERHDEFLTDWHLSTKIQFFVEGRLLAQRAWQHIPRVGDEIMLGPSTYRVMRVVFDVEDPEEDLIRWQTASIEIVPSLVRT